MADNKVDLNDADLFDKLENAVEPGLRDAPPKKEAKKESDNKETTVEEDWKAKFEESEREKENIAKRYEASSKEGKRLGQVEEEYNRLKPYEALLSRIGTDEQLQKMIEDHVKGVQEQPEFEDIITDPKKFSTMISSTVGAELDKRLGLQKQELEKEKKIQERIARDREFQSKYNLTADQMDEFKEKMKEKTLTHEDMWQLVYGKEIEQKKQNFEMNDVISQLQKAGALPKSLGSLESTENEKSDIDSVFDALKGTSKNVDDMLR